MRSHCMRFFSVCQMVFMFDRLFNCLSLLYYMFQPSVLEAT